MNQINQEHNYARRPPAVKIPLKHKVVGKRSPDRNVPQDHKKKKKKKKMPRLENQEDWSKQYDSLDSDSAIPVLEIQTPLQRITVPTGSEDSENAVFKRERKKPYSSTTNRKAVKPGKNSVKPGPTKVYTFNKGVYEQSFEPEIIRDYALHDGSLKYFVKWIGWDEADNTWEPAEHLLKCKYLLEQFFMERRGVYFEEIGRRRKRYELLKGSGLGAKIKVEQDRKPHLLTEVELDALLVPLPLLPKDPRSLEEIVNEFVSSVSEHGFTSEDIIKGIAKWGTGFPRTKFDPNILSKLIGKYLYEQATPSEIQKIREVIIKIEICYRVDSMRDFLQDWQNQLNYISKNKPTIFVENKVDLVYPPKNFVYYNLPEDIYRCPIPKRSSGCSCADKCFDHACCGMTHGAEFAYNHRRLIVPPGTRIYECNDNCDCSDDCPNRVVQDGLNCLKDMQYCIFRTLDRGWGVKTLKSLPKGTFAMFLVGEIVKSDVAWYRQQSLNVEEGMYLFDLELDTDSHVIDFSSNGNISRFVNHSCNPNLESYFNFYNEAEIPRIALYTTMDIPAGMELTWSYVDVEGFRDRYGQEFTDGMPEGFSECLCGSANCLKFMIFPD